MRFLLGLKALENNGPVATAEWSVVDDILGASSTAHFIPLGPRFIVKYSYTVAAAAIALASVVSAKCQNEYIGKIKRKIM